MEISAQEVLLGLFNPEDNVNIRVFADRRGDVFTGTKLSVECGKFASLEKTLKEHNAKNRGIFFVVNSGGQDDASITRINAQFTEMDEGSFEEQQKKIDEFSLAPSMIIKTRKSLHTYWFVKNAEVALFRNIQKRLVEKFGGDPMCVNESRVMRLPGFNHCKKEPIGVKCILFHPERKYTQAQLSAVLPGFVQEKEIEQKGSEKGLQVVCAECAFVQYCKDHASILSEHDWYAMITNLAVFEGGSEHIRKLSSPYPSYDAESTQKKINHYLASGTRPITCKTIAEKGFKCPKLIDGSCTVKAPAALCYRPMSLAGLRNILSKEPVTGNLSEDMQTAEHFVEQYLYNQNAVMAEAIIKNELREHFNFKANILNAFKSRFKQVNKAYEKGLEIRMRKVENELPPWYTQTEKGLRFLPGVLADNLAKNAKVIFAAEEYYVYIGGVYQPMAEMIAQHMCQEKMLISETKMNQIIDAEKQWRLLVRKEIRELNVNPYIINVKNGLYNVLEETLTPHSPENYSTVQLNVELDTTAKCPRFEKFLAEAMEGDMEQVKLLQEILGYFLIPINKAQKCFVVVGAAGAGKSVLLRVLNEVLLGKENVSNVSWQALNERFKTAELFGKLANIFADLPTKNIDDNGIFKALVGEDFLTVEKKNRNPFSFQSTARLLFSCNNIPKNYGDRSEGFYRRLIIVRFNKAVADQNKDPELINKFKTEANGIFLYALEGLKRLLNQNNKFSITQKNIDELQKYREESDSVLSFAKECCEVNALKYVGSMELFNAYKAYCEECGVKSFSQKAFISHFLTLVPTASRSKDRLGKRRVFKGVCLAETPD